ncbi:uncharacterized protein LOC121738874 [Aricia agestis]|uniref:uncharacterized protein LOC121738874 n=1 Tax=Aricia agestis TaxID=91739 RepID=UPI001C208110|nr:uncharacterized protein LOC121738874 [Aricia agestis]
MSLWKFRHDNPKPMVVTDGYLFQDKEALTACQRECSRRFATTLRIEQEAYLSQHPEVKAMLEVFVSKMVHANKKTGIMKMAAEHFTRPIEELDSEIRQRLSLPPNVPYNQTKNAFKYEDHDLEIDMRQLISEHNPTKMGQDSDASSSLAYTESSTFFSINTSETTLPTPDPAPTPIPTLSEHCFSLITNAINKAVYLHVDEEALTYDIAYTELMKLVEQAMDITVVEIKEDIAQMLFNAYRRFEYEIIERERIAAELAWVNRVSKKVRKSERLRKNFRGYETGETESEISAIGSKVPPPKPCICAPQFSFNRYPKDRFGIYLPREEEFSDGNVTAIPDISQAKISRRASIKSNATKDSSK